MLSDEEVVRIATAISKQMTDDKRALWIDPETHYNQHLFIKNMQENHKDLPELLDYMASHRTSMQEKDNNLKSLKNRLIGTVVVTGVLALLGLVGTWVIDVVGKIGKLINP